LAKTAPAAPDHRKECPLKPIARIAAALERAFPRFGDTPEGRYRAWAFDADRGFRPIERMQLPTLDDLLHLDRQKTLAQRNTRQFVNGFPANHMLLWGARGTGKSSLIRALLNHFGDSGLRLVEVDNRGLNRLPELVEPLALRSERFVIFADDLAFDADDAGYRALKALLDGRLGGLPENVLLYATSNRRHLVPEPRHENDAGPDPELHPQEASEERISLSERFGLWLAFHPLSQSQYLDVVWHHLARLGAAVPEAERDGLAIEAVRFATLRGSRSARVAGQFAADLAGRRLLQFTDDG
jgi:uncharacterized protein